MSGIRELLKPTRSKLVLTLILMIASYAILVGTKEVQNVPTLQMSEDGASFTMETRTGVEFNRPAFLLLTPISSFAMFFAFGGVPTGFTCSIDDPCDLAKGTSYLYLIALAINLPYYYWLASIASTLYEKVLR